MKKLLLLSAVLAGSILSAAEPVQAIQKKAQVYRPERYSLREEVTISNKHNRYPLVFTLSKPVGEKPQQFAMNLGGKTNQNFVGGFFSLTVNGIKMQELDFEKEKLSLWKEGDCSGMDLKLNFDGTKFTLRLFMRPDSPVLWGRLIYDKESVEPLTKAVVEFQALPSLLKIINKKVIFNGSYDREMITPAKTYTHNSKWVKLTPQDTSFIFQDKELDGSSEKKGAGPCWLFVDQSGVASGEALVRSSWKIYLKFNLKKDFQEMRFGIWQPAARISNSALAERLKTDSAAFTFK